MSLLPASGSNGKWGIGKIDKKQPRLSIKHRRRFLLSYSPGAYVDLYIKMSFDTMSCIVQSQIAYLPAFAWSEGGSCKHGSPPASATTPMGSPESAM